MTDHETLREELTALRAAQARAANARGDEARLADALKQVAEAGEAVRCLLTAPPPVAPTDPLADSKLIDCALQADDPASVLRPVVDPSPLEPASKWQSTDQPKPVLWRHDAATSETSTDVDAVLSVGEVAILSGAGGHGKSTVTLSVASAAADAAANQQPYGCVCGLRVAPGPVVVVSYEDAPARIAHRLTWMKDSKQVTDRILLWPDPKPLWQAAVESVESKANDRARHRLWRAIREADARLVIVDPVSAALADVSTSETAPVRAFLRELTREAAPDEAARWRGAGVLLVAHDTKGSRDAARRGEDPGAGVVAGSAAWFDGARGVLSLMRDPASDSNDRLLECVKANYGRTGWGARLCEDIDCHGRFRGLKLAACLDRSTLMAAKKQPANRGSNRGGTGGQRKAVGASEKAFGPGEIPK